MKAAFVFAILAIGFIFAFADDDNCPYNNGNGQATCNAANMATGELRNNWDPTRYWVCNSTSNGKNAISQRCPDQTGFMNAKLGCVGWDKWQWTAPCDPPGVLPVS